MEEENLMIESTRKVLLIVPCFNEAQRLDLIQFSKSKTDCDFIFVNDGSTDKTKIKLESTNVENIKVLHLNKNQGKANAIRTGFLHFLQSDNRSKYAWVGFWDADLATPLSEVSKMITYTSNYTDVKSIWCSRIYRLGSTIKRKYSRHILGRFFATLASLLLKIESYDSQCGAKLFKAEIIEDLFQEKFITRWIFDIELLIRLNQKKYKVIEYPVEYWEDISGSKLKPGIELFRTIIDLFKIKFHYKI